MSFNFLPLNKVDIPEIPIKKNITLASSKTALIIVDMQNDFVKDKGSLLVPSAKETVSNIKKLIVDARSKNAVVCYTQDTHFKDDKEWKIWPKHCEKDSWGWEIIKELKPNKNEMVFQKNRYDGFYGTTLNHYLSNVWKIENIVLTGTVSNICVAQTAASAGLRWYNIIIPADSISSLTEFDQALTLRQVSFLYNGIIVKSSKDIKFK